MNWLYNIACHFSVKWLCTIAPTLFVACNTLSQGDHSVYYERYIHRPGIVGEIKRVPIIHSFQASIQHYYAFVGNAVTGSLVWNNFFCIIKKRKSLHTFNQERQLKNDGFKQALASSPKMRSEIAKIASRITHNFKNLLDGIPNLLHSFISKQQPRKIKNTLKEIHTGYNTSIVIINELIKEEKSRYKDGLVKKSFMSYAN